MSRFAQDGYRVLYVDTVGLRSPKVRDFRRIASRLKSRLRASGGGVRLTGEGVYVHSPVLLPFLNSRLARRLNVEVLVAALKQGMAQAGCEDPILWVYLPTWTVLQCVQRIPHRMLVYNCIDALSENPKGVSRGYAEAEAEILRQADLVLTTSETLYREKSPHNPRTVYAPSGVDARWFEPVVPAPDVENLPRPRIGFFGMLDHRIDLKLIQALARAHRDWSFVLIGSARADLSGLLAERNVHFLGSRPHVDLPRYLAGLDVFLLPYTRDAFTYHIQPAKLYECLVFGKPVVASRLPALEEFGEVIRLASGVEDFSQVLREAVAENRPDLAAKRRAMAEANSWERRYREIRAYLKEEGD